MRKVKRQTSLSVSSYREQLGAGRFWRPARADKMMTAKEWNHLQRRIYRADKECRGVRLSADEVNAIKRGLDMGDGWILMEDEEINDDAT